MTRLQLVAFFENMSLNINMRRAKKCSSTMPRCQIM